MIITIGGVLIVHQADDTPLPPVDNAAGLDRWAGGTAAVTPGTPQGVLELGSHPHLAMKDTAYSDRHLWRAWNWLGWPRDWQERRTCCCSLPSDLEWVGLWGQSRCKVS